MNNTVSLIDFNSMPVGFRFWPTDEELVDYYLKSKLYDNDSNVHNVIAEVDVCKFEPWNLPALSVVKSKDQEWIFFCPCDYKYGTNSKRFNRATKCGFWKATGNDRNIKITGTNKIIATKKTLVFYEGRVTGNVKTNWVIHEYHAVTSDDSQKNFVVCRLMKKASVNTEDTTDSITCDEGESSRHTSSNRGKQAKRKGIPDVSSSSMIHQFSPVETRDEADPNRNMCSQATIDRIPNVNVTLPEMNLEPIIPAPHQEDNCFPSSTQQSTVTIEQQGACAKFPFLGAYVKNENNMMQTSFGLNKEEVEPVGSFANFRDEISSMQTPLETIEEEDEFMNSLLVDAEFALSDNIGHASVNGPACLESLRSVSYERSDINAEVVSALCVNTWDNSKVCHEHPSSSEFRVSKIPKSSHGDVHGSTSFLSSNNNTNKDMNENIIQDDILGMVTSSCDSTADKPLEINCNEISSSFSTKRRQKIPRRPRSTNFALRRAAAAAKRSHTQRKDPMLIVEAKKPISMLAKGKI